MALAASVMRSVERSITDSTRCRTARSRPPQILRHEAGRSASRADSAQSADMESGGSAPSLRQGPALVITFLFRRARPRCAPPSYSRGRARRRGSALGAGGREPRPRHAGPLNSTGPKDPIVSLPTRPSSRCSYGQRFGRSTEVGSALDETGPCCAGGSAAFRTVQSRLARLVGRVLVGHGRVGLVIVG
jgi:hypothetical protein